MEYEFLWLRNVRRNRAGPTQLMDCRFIAPKLVTHIVNGMGGLVGWTGMSCVEHVPFIVNCSNF